MTLPLKDVVTVVSTAESPRPDCIWDDCTREALFQAVLQYPCPHPKRACLEHRDQSLRRQAARMTLSSSFGWDCATCGKQLGIIQSWERI